MKLSAGIKTPPCRRGTVIGLGKSDITPVHQKLHRALVVTTSNHVLRKCVRSGRWHRSACRDPITGQQQVVNIGMWPFGSQSSSRHCASVSGVHGPQSTILRRIRTRHSQGAPTRRDHRCGLPCTWTITTADSVRYPVSTPAGGYFVLPTPVGPLRTRENCADRPIGHHPVRNRDILDRSRQGRDCSILAEDDHG